MKFPNPEFHLESPQFSNLSAINLLKERLDKTSPKWSNIKLEVLFGTKNDLIPGDYHLA